MYMPLNGHLENASSKTIQRGVTLNHILFLRSIKLKHWSVGLRRALLSLGTIQEASCSPQQSLCFLTGFFNSLNKLARSGTRYDEAHVGDFLLSELHLISS